MSGFGRDYQSGRGDRRDNSGYSSRTGGRENKNRSDRHGERYYDDRDDNHSGGKAAESARVKGYQAARRHDQDRRDRRNERLNHGPGSENESYQPRKHEHEKLDGASREVDTPSKSHSREKTYDSNQSYDLDDKSYNAKQGYDSHEKSYDSKRSYDSHEKSYDSKRSYDSHERSYDSKRSYDSHEKSYDSKRSYDSHEKSFDSKRSSDSHEKSYDSKRNFDSDRRQKRYDTKSSFENSEKVTTSPTKRNRENTKPSYESPKKLESSFTDRDSRKPMVERNTVSEGAKNPDLPPEKSAPATTSTTTTTAEEPTDLLKLIKRDEKDIVKLEKKTKEAVQQQEDNDDSNLIKAKAVSAADLEKQWQQEEETRKEQEKIEMEKERENIEAEEAKAAEEEKRRQEEEELQRIKDEEIKMLQDFIKASEEGNLQKMKLREKNFEAADNYPDDSYFSKLDSNLKKNTTFVKKLKNLTETQKASLVKDFNSLNLTKYVGEVAAALTEAKLKMSDVECAVHISSLVHQRYSEFSAVFLENWQKVLLSKKDDKVPNPSKLRVDLRFFADLLTSGIFTAKVGLPVLANQLMFLTNNDKEEHNNLSIILSFCKHCGDDYAGFIPQRYRLLAEKYNLDVPKSRSTVLPDERKKGCSKLLKDYYASLCTHILAVHKNLKSIEKQNRKILQTKGELSQERKDKHEAALQTFQKLQQHTGTYADLIDEQVPDLPHEKMETEDEIMGIDIYSPDNDLGYDGESSLFEDEDTRQFYENIPDLKSIVPQILYKDSQNAIAAASEDDKEAQDESLVEDTEINVEELEKEMEKEQKEVDVSMDDELPPAAELEADDDFDIATSMRQILDAFLSNLPNCVNRDLIDKAAIEFCMNLNTKANRKKLVKTLFTVHRTRYDLLPFYSRFVATLHPCMPEVATDLLSVLKGDFKWHVRKKDQINIESKLKTVRFIGELTKFKMCPKTEALHCVKMLLFDFSHHNIEMGSALLEICGRFLYRSPDSHHRTKVYLDVMMRKKTALHFDQRYLTLIENAYYYSNPPESKQREVIKRPTIQEYIRKLLYKDLSKITTEKILRQMRKLDWDDPDIMCYATHCLAAVWNVRYNVIHCCANLLAGLAPYHEKAAIGVVDGVIEDIRLGLEVNHPKYNQRRISCVKYLAELYNYRLVESTVIFKTLYSFVTFGVILDDSIPSPLDPAEHLFRIRLVCTILDTCGQYFDRGSSKKKLDCFMIYFQRYYWFKRKHVIWSPERPFPLEMEYSFHDTFDALRPKLGVCKSYEEATSAVEELEKDFRAKLAEVLPNVDDKYEMKIEDTDGTLATIHESEDTAVELSQSQHMSPMMSVDTYPSQSQESNEGGRGDASGRDRHNSNSQSQGPRMEVDDGEEGGRGGGGSYSDGEGSRGRSGRTGEEGNATEEEEDDDDGDKDDDSDNDSDMSTGDEGDDDRIKILTGGPKVIKCTEDDDFMSSFDKMLNDSIQNRIQDGTKVPAMDIAVPMHIRSQRTKYYVPGEEELEEAENEQENNAMKFMLMTRKGNKQQFSNLNVPVTEKFATEYREREQAEKQEKERMKRVVLNIHERQEEEDYQELVASMNRPVGPHHLTKRSSGEPKVKPYQHPKGAPDADLIFGSKKR